MRSIVIGDLTNLCLSTNNKNYCGMINSVESLFTLYIVCYICKRRRKKRNFIFK